MGEGHLEQILDNLIANALDVLPAGGAIRITAGAVGDRARIIVADNGPGMSEQQQKVAFRRFATSNGGGTGPRAGDRRPAHGRQRRHCRAVGHSGGGLTVTIDLPLARRERGQRRGSTCPRGQLPADLVLSSAGSAAPGCRAGRRSAD